MLLRKEQEYIKLILLLFIILTPISVHAGRGCCSWHGGESGNCTSNGRSICNDGTISPSCECNPYYEFDNDSETDSNEDIDNSSGSEIDSDEDIDNSNETKFFKNVGLDTIVIITAILINFIMFLIDYINAIILKYKSNKIAKKSNYKNWYELEKKYIKVLNLENEIKNYSLKKKLDIISQKRGYKNFNTLYKLLKKDNFKIKK